MRCPTISRLAIECWRRQPCSRTLPELNGIKWQQMALFTKIRIWDDAISYKKATKKWRDLCKRLQKPGFSGQKAPLSGKALVPRHPRRSGEPEPSRCANTVRTATTHRDPGQDLYLPTDWMTTRALDPRCGEDDGRGRMTAAARMTGARTRVTSHNGTDRCVATRKGF